MSGALTILGPGHLTLTKSAGGVANAKSGDTVTYTIQYKNDGGGIATNSIITDPVPAGTMLATGPIPNGGTVSAGIISWNLGTIAAGASGSVSFQVKVN